MKKQPVTKKIELPQKPSALLRLAVQDSIKVSKLKTRKLVMTTWHSYSAKDKVCNVCMAGAVMDRTLKLPARRTLDAHETLWADEMVAIDYMRMGRFEEALHWLGLSAEVDSHALKLDVIGQPVRNAYLRSHLERAPWRVYLKAARELERIDL